MPGRSFEEGQIADQDHATLKSGERVGHHYAIEAAQEWLIEALIGPPMTVCS